MATPKGGTPVEPGMIERAAAGLRYLFTGQTPPWFGPNEPLQPVAPPEVKGRPMDFPTGVNLNYKPGAEGSVGKRLDFDTLRRAADPTMGGLDLLRLAIETRKDQMEAQRWKIRGRDGKDGGQRAKDLELALRRPDLVHTFRQWARQLWEDLLVIDAPAIYLRPMPEGFKIPEVMDGALLKRLVDQNGRTPLPPDPAFQQVLKGLPAVDYTLDEILYCPRNLRSHTFYGFSPVEQVVNIINLALKRQLHLVGFYTEGNMPEHLIGAPEGWTPEMIKEAQAWVDNLMQGNVEARRKGLLVPAGMVPHPLKDPKMADPLDEWLARVICWCFSLSPGALVKEVNRASGENMREMAITEGLEPLKEWWADVMNEVILRCWGAEDLVFTWQDEEITDPTVKATFWKSFVDAKVVTADEVREKALGMDPLTPEQKEELNPPAPEPFGMGGDGLEAPGGGKAPVKPGTSQEGDGGDSASRRLPPDTSKLEKKKSMRPIPRNRKVTRAAIKAIRAAATDYLTAIREAVLAELPAEKLAKADLTGDQLRAILANLPPEDRARFLRVIQERMEEVAQDGAERALTQVLEVSGAGVTDETLDAMLSQANTRAIAWAERHAADLVTRIDETTRTQLADLVGRALDEGLSNQELAGMIFDGETFGDYRAEMIARTETAFADVQGNLEGYKASGVVEGKQWIIAQDEFCDDCQELDGMVVPLDGTFPGGDPPLHPNCRCDILPVLGPTEEE